METKKIERNERKTRLGVVKSNKMDKTIVVVCSDKVKHPIYGKTMNRTVSFKAHDPENICSVGDTVLIAETRHLSKDKNWRLVKIVEKVK